MSGLTKEQIIKVPDLKSQVVSVPEWGGEVTLQELDGRKRDEFEAYLITDPGSKDSKINLQGARAKLLSLSIVDEKKQQMFLPEEISSKSGVVLNRLFEIAQKLSGLSDEEADKIKSDLKKGQGADSPSA